MKNRGKRIFLSLFTGIFVLITALGIRVKAAEYSVTDVLAVLYTNESTTLCADADTSTVVVPIVKPDLPIQVTGVTSNGYFRISVAGQTFYVPGIGLTAPQQAVVTQTQQAPSVYDQIIAHKAVFPEGMRWTNDDYVPFRGGIYSGGYGCAGFAFYISDAIWGDAPAKIHTDYSNIRVGDMLRINHDTHTVMVLEVRPNSVVVAEGNYNSKIHWGREISKANIIDESSYIMTRY